MIQSRNSAREYGADVLTHPFYFRENEGEGTREVWGAPEKIKIKSFTDK